MTALAATLTPDIVASAADAACHLGNIGIGYAATGVWGFMSVYHRVTGVLQPTLAIGNAVGAFLLGYHYGRTDRHYSVPVSIVRGVALAPVGAFLGYGLAPAVLPVIATLTVCYLQGNVTIVWDEKKGTLTKLDINGPVH